MSVVFYYISLWKSLAYVIFFLAMIVEGEIFLFTAFFLAQQGLFNPLYMLVTIFSGVTLGDWLWYQLGSWLNTSNSFLARWASKISQPFDKQIMQNPFRVIAVSKFLYGVHHAILLRIGSLKLDLKEFLKDDLKSNIIWILAVGGLGYVSGASFGIIKHYLRFAEIVVLIFVLLIILAERLIGRVSRKRF